MQNHNEGAHILIIAYSVLVIFIFSFLYLSVYFENKKAKKLLDKVLNRELLVEQIWITERNNDGYQYIQFLIKDGMKEKVQTLEGSMDIEEVCKKLTSKGFSFSGKYIR